MAAVFGSGLVLTAVPAGAETLGEAIALAFETNPDLLRQRSVLRNSDETFLRSRITNLQPSFTVTSTVSANANGDLINGGSVDVGNDETGASLGVSATANQTIYNGGQRANAIESARYSLLQARETYRRSEQTTIQTVVAAYTGVRRAEAQVEIATQAVGNFERSLDEAQAKYDVGSSTLTDKARAESSLAQAKSSLISAQNALESARNDYLLAVGQMPGTLVDEPALEMYLPTTVDAAYEMARQNNQQLRNAYILERTTALAVANARAARWPSVSVSTGISGSQQNLAGVGGGFGDFDAGWTSSVSLSVPLLPARTTNSNIRTAEENHRQAEIGIEQQLRTLRRDVQQQWNNLAAARSNIEALQTSVDAQELTAAGSREEFAVGIGTQQDILNDEQTLRQQQQQLVNAQFSLYTQTVQFLILIGTLEPEQFQAQVDPFDTEAYFRSINGFKLPWEGLVETLDKIAAPAVPSRVPNPGEVPPTIDLPR